MTQLKDIPFFRILTLFLIVIFVAGCAQYGMISENDVYMQKPTALSTGEDESDLTSYNAYKARERGAYEDRYLIDQMYDRRYYGTLLYGGSFMGGTPFYSGNFITWGYMNPIRGYQNTYYFNSFYNWNRPWTYAYGYGYNPYNPYANGIFGYGYPTYYPFGTPYGTYPYGSNNMIPNNNVSTAGNHFSGQKRFSLSSNAPRSSSYPATLKSNTPGNGGSSSGNLSTTGTSRRAAGKQSVQSSHMPFKNSSANGSSSQNYVNNTGGSYRTYSTRSSRKNVSQSRSTRTQYTPSRSARNSGVTRTPRTTSNYERTGYSNSSTRRTTSGSSSRSPSYNSRTRSVSSSSRSVGGSRSTGSSSSSSSSSNSGRR